MKIIRNKMKIIRTKIFNDPVITTKGEDKKKKKKKKQ